MNNTG